MIRPDVTKNISSQGGCHASILCFCCPTRVALVLGCQDVGTGPAGSDGPQFHVDLDKHPEGHGGGGDGDGGGGDNPGSPFYEYTFTKGPLTMDLVPAGARPTVGNSQAGEIVLRAHFHDEMEKLNLSAALVDQFGARTWLRWSRRSRRSRRR